MLKIEILASPVGIQVYINENLCCYCKLLWSKCKKLREDEWIEAFWVSNRLIKLRVEEGDHSQISMIF